MNSKMSSQMNSQMNSPKTPSPPTVAISLDDQITAATTEALNRERLYSQWVRLGRMTQVEADFQLNAMRCIAQTLMLHRICADKIGRLTGRVETLEGERAMAHEELKTLLDASEKLRAVASEPAE
jgi:hypothetical protein